MQDISVIVTVYNQSLEAVLATLRSVVYQRNIEPEVIVADDCSDDSLTQNLHAFFVRHDYENYRIIEADANVQTVRNILGALLRVEGEYVKVIGAGDILYDERTLEGLVAWCRENKVNAGFGKILRFERQVDRCLTSRYDAPLNAEDYALGSQRNRQALLKRQLVRGDWIPAGTQFFERDLLANLLKQLEGYGVRYCEDFAATLALSSSDVVFYPEPVEWYEWGVGISTGGSKASERLYRDHACLYSALARERPLGLSLAFPRTLFGVKRFIALHTPWYAFFRRRLVETYAHQGSGDSPVIPNDFLRRCLADARS